MDKQIQQERTVGRPNYQKIFQDIITKKFPEKMDLYHTLLKKEELTILDIIKINKMIFGAEQKEIEILSRKHYSYDIETIVHILTYQKVHSLNNIQLASQFKLSRNTVAKWKKMDLV